MDNARIYIKNLSVQTREDGSLYSDIFFQFLISKRKEDRSFIESCKNTKSQMKKGLRCFVAGKSAT